MTARDLSLNLKDFLNEYGDLLKEKVIKSLKPIYHPQKKGAWEREQEEKLKQLKRQPFPAQKDAILALAKGFYKEGKKGLIAVGEMGTGKCVAKDTLIHTGGPLVPVQDLFAEYADVEKGVFDGEGYFYPLKKPLSVLSLNKEGKLCLKRVKSIYRQKVKTKLRRITLSDGSSIMITQIHKLLTPHGWTAKLSKGDYVAVPMKELVENPQRMPVSPELLAYMLAEGSENPTCAGAVITQKDERVLLKLKCLAENCYGVSRVIFTRCKNRAPHIRISGKEFRKWMISIGYPWGTRSAERKIPNFVMQASDRDLANFLRAFFDSEGSIETRLNCQHIELTTASKIMANQLKALMKRFGIKATIRCSFKCATNGSGIKRPYYRAGLSGIDVQKWSQLIGSDCERKRKKLMQSFNIKRNSNWGGVYVADIVGKLKEITGVTRSISNLFANVYVKGLEPTMNPDTALKLLNLTERIINGDLATELRAKNTPASLKLAEKLSSVDMAEVKKLYDLLKYRLESDFTFLRIESIEDVDYDDWVYDLEVEDTHNFVANHIIVHNTIMSLATSYLMPKSAYRVIIMCPPHLVQKWIREIKKTIPNAIVVNLNGNGLKELEQLRKAGKPKAKEYYVLGRERAKLHYSVTKTAWLQKHLKRVLCPRCGADVKDVLKKRKRPLCECGEPLYQAENKLRRFAKAEYIKKYLKGKFDLFIADEVHELKGGTTAQGQAFACLTAAAKKTLALTGTLMGGYSTNLFYILWRLMPSKMHKKKIFFKSPKQFAELYGVLEESREERNERIEDEYGEMSIGRSRGARVIVKEKPGISPIVLTDFLLEHCIFMRLSDVSNALPPYEEEVVEVEMLPEQKEAYKTLESDLYAEVQDALRYGSHSLLGALVNSLLAYPDGARRGEIVLHPYSGDEVASAPPIDAYLLPKEEKLLEILKKEIAEGRKCLVYVEHTGTRDLTGELAERIRKVGLRPFVLKSTTVKAEQREEYVKKIVPVCDVLIANPRLVQTGLDLIDFPTVIFFQTGYSIFTLRQASRRSWRIGQKEPVRVYYLCYSDTMQERALSLIAEKLEAALAVEGDLSDKGLVAIAESSNSMLYELARTLVGEKKTKALSESWKNYKRKEIQTDSLLGIDEAEEETTTTTITKGDRKVTVKYTKVVRGRIYPQKGYAIGVTTKGKRLLFKQGIIYFNGKPCGHYQKDGRGKIADYEIAIMKAKSKPYYLLVELKPEEEEIKQAA